MDKSDKVWERDDREMDSQEQQTGHQKATAWYTQTDTGWLQHCEAIQIDNIPTQKLIVANKSSAR